jgi:uncharacterized membrane protein YtjA (UPF0391 family)
MLGSLINWAIILLVIAVIAAVFGFGGVAGTATNLAVTLFWIALVLAVVLFVVSLFRGRSSSL